MPSNHLILFHTLLLLLSIFPSTRVFSTELILGTFTLLLTTRLLGKIPQLIMVLICWGECAVSSVLSHCTKNLKWQTSVTAWLQLSFIWQAKEHSSLRGEAGRPKRREGLSLAPAFIYFFSSPEPALCKMGWLEALFVSPDVLTLVLRFSFLPFSWAFPFFVF